MTEKQLLYKAAVFFIVDLLKCCDNHLCMVDFLSELCI